MIRYLNRKSMKIRESGRSSDFISPSFGFGCLYNCSYCYMKRHKPEGLDVARNIGTILTAINDHVTWLDWPKKPNQTHNTYYTYDISCNEDFALHRKYYDWEYIFDYFKNSDKALATLATKTIPLDFLKYNPNKKVRIRFSLMPEFIRKVLEPNTPTIEERLGYVNAFIEAGYEVHLNFSPVVYYKNWLNDYIELFRRCDSLIKKQYKDEVLAEVIFLTHNESKHDYNVTFKISGEKLLWKPSVQESKISEYGGKNIRYQREFKSELVSLFREEHDKEIPWNKIRYIF